MKTLSQKFREIFALLALLMVFIPANSVQAADAVVETCSFASLQAAVATANAGGGTITFTCSGTITFTAVLTINANVVIEGSNNITFSRSGNGRHFTVNAGATLTLNELILRDGNATGGGPGGDSGSITNNGTLNINNTTFTNNNANRDGGAIYNNNGTLTISNSIFSNNTAGRDGGAIYNQTNGTTISNTAFNNNTATGSGGAINSGNNFTLTTSSFTLNSGATGGAIRVIGGGATITRTSFANNSANTLGGAIRGEGGALTITNSTFHANTYTLGGGMRGGGAISSNNGAHIARHVTFLNNTSPALHRTGGGGGNSLTLFNSIIAGTGALCTGTTANNSNRATGNTCDNATNNTLAQLNLGAFTGGIVPLNIGSTAIDNALTAQCTGQGVNVDQRGITRPQGVACDVGAYELQLQTVTLAFDTATSSALEGTGIGNVLRVTTSDNAVTASAVTVTISVTGGTASATDYQSFSGGVLTIPADTAHNTVISIGSAFAIVNDNIVESDETVELTLSAPTGSAVLGAQTIHTHTILNDDTAAVTIGDVSLSEGNAGTTTFTFTATLDNAVQGGFTVNYATADGTATIADGDYQATTGTLTFAGNAGETQTFSVLVNGDTKVEPNETFTVSMNTVSNANVTITDTSTGTIQNDDTAAVSIGDVSLSEGNAGTTTFTFTATLDNAVQGGFTVNYATADGTATIADGDYQATTGTLTFAGNAGETQTFSVLVNGDTKVEPNETFTVSMNTVSNANVTITDAATGTIQNDDTAAVSIGDVSLSEGNAGTTTFTFTATLDNAVQGGFTVNYATTDGTATIADGDYQATTGTLTFAGNAGETQTFSVLVNGDTKVEPNETFTVSMNTVSNANVTITDTATGTIQNDDIAGITLTESGGSTDIVEGGATDNFTLVANTPPTADVNININTDGQCTVNPTTVTLPANSTATQIVIVTAVDDATVEGNHSCVITTGNTTSTDTFYNNLAVANVTANVTDNDAEFNINANQVNVLEGTASANAFSFTVTRTGANQLEASVDLGYSGAILGTDFALDNLSAGTLVGNRLNFPANTTGITITFNTIANAVNQADRTLTVTLSNGIIAGTASISAVNGSAQTIISDDDTVGVTVSETSVGVTEGGAGASFTVVLTSQPSANVDITLGLTGGAPNGAQLNSTLLTFSPANWDTAQTVSVSAIDDAVAEGVHTDAVTFSVASGDGSYNNFLLANVTVTITDNDVPGIVFNPLAGLAVVEGNNTGYTVALTSQPTADVTVTLNTLSSETTINPNVLLFTTANWNTAQSVTLSVANNDVADGTRNAIIVHAITSVGDAIYDALVDVNYVLEINDDDTPGVTVNPTSLTINEGASDTYTMRLTSQPSVGETVTVAISFDNVTFPEVTIDPVGLQLTFDSTNWSTEQVVTVNITDDAITQGNRAVTLNHAVSNAGGTSYNAITTADVVLVTIVDTDSPNVTITPNLISVPPGSSDQSYDVILVTQPSGNVTIMIAVDDSTVCDVTPSTLIFTSGDFSVAQTVTVSVLGSEGTICTLTHTAAGGNYDGVMIDQMVLNIATPPPAVVTPVEVAQSGDSGVSIDNSDPSIWDIRLVSSSPFILPGQEVTFTITVRKLVGGTPVQVNFPLPSGIAIQSVSSTRGAVGFSGQLVTYTDDIKAGEEGLVQVLVRADTAPLIGSYEACIVTPVDKCASLILAQITQLPATGETPFWRNVLLLVLTLGTLSVLMLGRLRIRRRLS